MSTARLALSAAGATHIALVALTVVLNARLAHALSGSHIPDDCGSLSGFQVGLQRRLGNARSIDDVRVTIEPELSGYRLTVELANERRELHDQSCPELLRAAFVIALAALQPEKATLPPAPLDPPRVDALGARPAWPRWQTSVAAGLTGGLSPRASLLLELEARLNWRHLGVAAGLRYLFPSDVRDQTNHGARVGGSGAYLAGTFSPWPRVQGRLGLVGYRLSGEGLGTVRPSEDTAYELAPLLGASFTAIETAAFSSSIAAEGQINLLRPVFEIEQYGPVFRVPLWAGSVIARASFNW